MPPRKKIRKPNVEKCLSFSRGVLCENPHTKPEQWHYNRLTPRDTYTWMDSSNGAIIREAYVKVILAGSEYQCHQLDPKSLSS